jgi:hypothetical protein
MADQIDKIVIVDIIKEGFGGPSYSVPDDYIKDILQKSDKLHELLHVTMPSNNYW